MPLTGVDISHHQNDAGADLPRLLAAVDFVLIKATQGAGYVDPAYAGNMAAARAAGTLRGAYHFAGTSGAVPGDPVAEADHFVDVAGHQPGEVLVLDWEPTAPPADPDGWCAAFLARVAARTGVVAMIYMSEAVTRQRDWAKTRALGPGLWVARYGANTGTKPALTLNVGSWGRYAMWQFTSAGRVTGLSGLVDVDEFSGDAAAWLAYGGSSSSAAAPASAPAPAAPAVVPAFDVRGWRLHYGDNDPRLPALRRWANHMYPGYKSTPLDAGPTTNYGPQLRAFLAEFGARIGVPNDGNDLGPRLAAGLYAQGFRG